MLYRSAGVFRVEVRPHHAASHTAALAGRAQASRPGLQMPTPDGSGDDLTSRLLCLVIIVCRPTHPSYSRRRPSFSGRRFVGVEQNTLPHNVTWLRN